MGEDYNYMGFVVTPALSFSYFGSKENGEQQPQTLEKLKRGLTGGSGDLGFGVFGLQCLQGQGRYQHVVTTRTQKPLSQLSGMT